MDLVYLDRVGMNSMVYIHQAHVNEGIILLNSTQRHCSFLSLTCGPHQSVGLFAIPKVYPRRSLFLFILRGFLPLSDLWVPYVSSVVKGLQFVPQVI